MKLKLYFIKLVSLLIFLSLFSPILANKIDSVIEEDLKKITSKLRCMTCQNQTIYDSDAVFSLDIKKIVGEKLQNGEKEKEIINFLIQRYGEYIIFKPLMSVQNIFLWYFPFIILALSLVFLIFQTRKNS